MTTCTGTIIEQERLYEEWQQEIQQGKHQIDDPPSELTIRIVTYKGDQRHYYFAWVTVVLFLLPTVLFFFLIRLFFLLARRLRARNPG